MLSAVDASPATDGSLPTGDSATQDLSLSSPTSLTGCDKKRAKRSDFAELDNAQYQTLMKARRKEKERERERSRNRAGRSYPARDQERQEMRDNLAALAARQQASRALALPAPSAPPPDQSSREARTRWSSIWSEDTPLLVMDEPYVEHDAWWSRLQKHGFVAGNTFTHGVEQDRLSAAARDRRHSV